MMGHGMDNFSKNLFLHPLGEQLVKSHDWNKFF